MTISPTATSPAHLTLGSRETRRVAKVASYQRRLRGSITLGRARAMRVIRKWVQASDPDDNRLLLTLSPAVPDCPWITAASHMPCVGFGPWESSRRMRTAVVSRMMSRILAGVNRTISPRTAPSEDSR